VANEAPQQSDSEGRSVLGTVRTGHKSEPRLPCRVGTQEEANDLKLRGGH
jgi:hypothetical protein